MRFVPIKTCEQQGVMSLHRVREAIEAYEEALKFDPTLIEANISLAKAYARELERSKLPGYRPPADVISDAGEEDFDTRSAEVGHAPRADSRQDPHHDPRLGEGVAH